MREWFELIAAGVFIGAFFYSLLEAIIFKWKNDGWQFWKEWFK